MLSHQIEFSKSIQEIYKPISGRVSDPDSVIAEGNPEGIRACEEYEAIVHNLQETLAPELEMIETRIIKPADELLEIVKIIQKVLTKRQHKQLDYDRRRQSLKKLQEKKEKTLKDEKNLYKTETELEQSTEEFNYFNELLKDELPKLFKLEREFIRPLFQSFYYMQLNIFYTLHEKMQAINIDSPPPPYSSNTTTGETSLGISAIAKAKAKPPPPKPKPKAFAAATIAAETATALYDYEAQAEGDLSFSVNDTIEIVQRTSNENEWWTGKLRGKTGQFPGKAHSTRTSIRTVTEFF
ncbi:Endophilin-A1 [Orbilia brochopaga]|nr:Endophilin-A1 [Drechslerella brochopaga]